ncbi:MAG: isoprenyl transferase [Gammaproteobacteria bacterium]
MAHPITLKPAVDEIPPLVQRPQHIAIIMDGNGRWAQARGLSRTAGHRAGVTALRQTVQACVELQIPILTVFAFSSENWSRPLKEVQFLLSLIAKVLQREVDRLYKENIRLRVIGDKSRFSPRLQTLIYEAEKLTENNTGLQLNIAANYGGQWDITQAAKKMAQQVLDKEVDLETITEETLAKNLCLSELVSPDLLIRTSGEQRISNFLLWQFAYTEMYFSSIYWPDFNKNELVIALREFAMRQRRFGLTSSQIVPQKVHSA